MNEVLRRRLMQTALAISVAGGAGTGAYVYNQDTPEVLLAHEMGAYFESSGKHIGTPYVDKNGAGQPWTVCNGITGSDVIPGKYYSETECKDLELKHLRKAEKLAKSRLKYWDSYNVWVRASFIDVAYNLPAMLDPSTTLMNLANSGQLEAACNQMPRWVFGTVGGQKVRLGGLVIRREANNELCSEWGRDGHFSYEYLDPYIRRAAK